MMIENKTCADYDHYDQNISIPIEEYDRLMENDTKLDALLTALSKDARLNWDETKLRFEDRYLEPTLAILFQGNYERWFRNIKKGESND